MSQNLLLCENNGWLLENRGLGTHKYVLKVQLEIPQIFGIFLKKKLIKCPLSMPDIIALSIGGRPLIDMVYSVNFSLVLRLTLIWRLGLILHEEATACHTTVVHIQNGTFLNTSRWRQNGFFGNLDRMPQGGRINSTFQNKTIAVKVKSNDVAPHSLVCPFSIYAPIQCMYHLRRFEWVWGCLKTVQVNFVADTIYFNSL